MIKSNLHSHISFASDFYDNKYGENEKKFKLLK